MVKVAINGFGRIGRNALKILLDRHDVQVVAINDITDAKTLAHLLKYDSSYGTYDKKVTASNNSIIINTREIQVFAEKDPANLPWKKLGVDVVIESTGFFTDPAAARAHIDAGAKRVVISAPAKGEGAKTVVLGVNEEVVEDGDIIISNASCTTNCIGYRKSYDDHGSFLYRFTEITRCAGKRPPRSKERCREYRTDLNRSFESCRSNYS